MSLKKTNDVQKISKPRKKLSNKLDDISPVEKLPEIEFNCSIYFTTRPSNNIQYYCIAVETMQYFSFLTYELSLESNKTKNIIDISIRGLKAKNSYANEAGPAKTEILFKDLYGKYIINIIKQDGSINSVELDINVFKKEINMLSEFMPEKENNRKFCSFTVSKNKFSFIKEGLI